MLSNMVAVPIFQLSKGWLKLDALPNIAAKVTALETSQLFIVDVDALLNAVASANIFAKFVISETSHPPRFWLNEEAP